MKFRSSFEIILGTAVVLNAVLICPAESWNGITPLSSTRADVERVLGKKNEDGSYSHEVGKVRVFYGAGQREATGCIGKAHTNVVGWIAVSVEIPLSVSELKLDRRQFTEVESSGTLDLHSKSLGITYGVGLDDMEVYSITYWPTMAACRAFIEANP